MKTYRRLVALLRETMNLSLTEAQAALRGVEAEAVYRCGGRNKVIRQAFGLRHIVSNSALMRRYPKAKDCTTDLIQKGYSGKRRVLVHDGIVVSHGHGEYHAFAVRFLKVI
jgi:hypothetical protein